MKSVIMGVLLCSLYNTVNKIKSTCCFDEK
jgi:hypothetical protein